MPKTALAHSNRLRWRRCSMSGLDAALRAAGEQGAPRARRRDKIRIQTQFTPGFGDWLIRHRVGLVCSTYRTGHLLFIGVRADGRPVLSAAGFSRAMGLATDLQRLYLGTNTEIWRLENVLHSGESESDTFDRLYVPRNSHVTGDVGIHEMGVEPNGRILFINTRYSCLATVSQTQAFKPLWKPTFISSLAPEDRCHLNGLAMENGRARYVTACSTGDRIESWRSGGQNGGVLIDIETDRIIADGLSMPHSPRVVGDAIYVLESGRGILMRIDRNSGRRDDLTSCPGFARGLAFVSHYAILTISLPRSGAFDGLVIAESLKARGAAPWRGLMIVDLQSGYIVEWLRLEGDVMELFDVETIPNARCPGGIGQYVDIADEETPGDEMKFVVAQ
jgi:uncharacterized protein (TIGR03032 family)